MRILTLLLLVSLIGCQQRAWVQPGVSQTQTDRDRFECENQVVREYGGWRNVEPFTAAARIQECMRVRGYQQQPVGSASSSSAYTPPSAESSSYMLTDEEYNRRVGRPPAAPPPEAANDYRDDPTCRRPNGLPCGTP